MAFEGYQACGSLKTLLYTVECVWEKELDGLMEIRWEGVIQASDRLWGK